MTADDSNLWCHLLLWFCICMSMVWVGSLCCYSPGITWQYRDSSNWWIYSKDFRLIAATDCVWQCNMRSLTCVIQYCILCMELCHSYQLIVDYYIRNQSLPSTLHLFDHHCVDWYHLLFHLSLFPIISMLLTTTTTTTMSKLLIINWFNSRRRENQATSWHQY